MKKAAEVAVCSDCFDFIETSEMCDHISDDVEQGWSNLCSGVEILENKVVHLYNWHYAGESFDVAFSNNLCECCGSKLSGRRFKFICML